MQLDTSLPEKTINILAKWFPQTKDATYNVADILDKCASQKTKPTHIKNLQDQMERFEMNGVTEVVVYEGDDDDWD